MVRYELMRPDEVVQAREQASIAYVPIGPLEWHGPHLPLGLDGLHAHEVCARAAASTGGVVLPTLFAGTETVRSETGAQSLDTLGLPPGERIVGMDFPAHSVDSTYYEEGAFAVTVRELVGSVLAGGFACVLLVNGHGAVNHQAALRRIAAEADRPGAHRVVYHLAFLPEPDALGPGHAAREETALGLALWPERVQRDLLPEELPYAQFGIVDALAFDGHPAPGHVLPAPEHPNAATAEEGEAMLTAEAQALAARAHALLRTLA